MHTVFFVDFAGYSFRSHTLLIVTNLQSFFCFVSSWYYRFTLLLITYCVKCIWCLIWRRVRVWFPPSVLSQQTCLPWRATLQICGWLSPSLITAEGGSRAVRLCRLPPACGWNNFCRFLTVITFVQTVNMEGFSCINWVDEYFCG